jgi:TRAP-type C4-dicarboxylate transport system substrate-binding protein
MMTSSSTGVNTSAWDFLTHFYDAQAWLPKNIVVVNTEAFEALDEETRAAVLAAAEAAQTRGWEASAAEHEAQMAVLADNGITVSAPSEALAASMRDIGAEMAANWRESAGEAGAAVLEAYGQ